MEVICIYLLINESSGFQRITVIRPAKARSHTTHVKVIDCLYAS